MERTVKKIRALALGALGLLALRSLEAQTVTTFYSFPAAVGSSPQAALIQGTDGNFYGTTNGGGGEGYGTVFKITPSGVGTVLHTFGTRSNDGANPAAALVQGSDGYFYGTTKSNAFGASLAYGTVFKVSPSGSETVLYNFGTIPNDAAYPQAALVQGGDGNFYGTTPAGGSRGGGTLFKITPSGTESVLYSFGTNPNDGSPNSTLVLGNDGNFYGTTNSGGPFRQGTVFMLTPAGSETVLYSFGTNPNDGNNPTGLVQGSDGNFYGTTMIGGSQGNGTVFEITPSGSETVLYNFGTNPNDAANPNAPVVEGRDGNFYGTTYNGGDWFTGTVFEITPAGAETVLYRFGTNGGDNGGQPTTALVQGSDGNFYGTVSLGGSQYHGMAFEITPSGTETVLYSFNTNPTDASVPSGPPLQGSDGNLYGTTYGGGSQNEGMIYELTPSSTRTVLHSFSTNPNDGYSSLSLVQGTDGNFYGATTYGGSQNQGIVFKITPSGTETVNYSFGASSNDGTQPYVTPILGTDGNFYGTTYQGGSQNKGTVFKISPSGAEMVLYSFGTNSSDAVNPRDGLVQSSDGNFYGTSAQGGSQNKGAVFKITPFGAESVLYNFGTIPNDGFSPGALVQGDDGNLYGTTGGGGSQGYGTFFKVTPTGTETVLYSFGTNLGDGQGPVGGLVQGSDGTFYGTTLYDGSQMLNGTVFKITPSGTETVLYTFGTNPNDGYWPSALTAGSDGSLYGTTQYGGANGSGIIFKVSAAQPVVAVSHVGAFAQGDGADTLTFQVSNGGGTTATDTVRLTDVLPTGLALSASNQGTINGWSVSISGQTLTATRSDALAPGNDYPILPITVSVGDDAPASVTNTANVTGGGQILPGNNSGTDTITISRSALNDWRQTYFPGSTSATGPGADHATPLNDGICNLLKFATGMNPMVPAANPGALGIGNGELTFTYTPSAAAVASGFSFLVEYNDDPAVNAWAFDIVNQGTIGSSGSPVTATVPTGSDGRRFVRLKVTKP